MSYSAVVAYGYEGWINPWMNARRISSVALAKDDTFRRVALDEVCGGCHGCKPVGLHEKVELPEEIPWSLLSP